MPSGSGPTPTSKPISDRKHSIDSNEINRNAAYTRSVSFDPTDYVQKARVTKTTPPKPALNPLQFVQLKPSNLFVNAQELVKKAEEVKKSKEVTKEEPEDWQCNLDSWKSSRRKRVEHIIDRVVEVKKLELVEHDRNRKKSATFSEMMEKRGGRSKLAVYNDEDTNDLSDLGIGTSSASGKSSLSDDFDNQSVISDNQDTEKSFEMESITRSEKVEITEENNNRDYTSSPGTGYDTSSSAAPTSSPDPSEYTYEGAIQEYKSRVSRAGQVFNGNDPSTERKNGVNYYISPMKKHSFPTSKFDDRYMEIIRNNNNNDSEKEETVVKLDLPKVDIHKRKELFEKVSIESTNVTSRSSAEITSTKSIKERLSNLEQNNTATETSKKGAEIASTATIKDRLVNLEKEVEVSVSEKVAKAEIPLTTVSLKDRLSSLQTAVENSATVKEEDKFVVKLEDVQETEMEMESTSFIEQQAGTCGEEIEANPEDSGFHTTDVSYTNSQADENLEAEAADETTLMSVEQNNCDIIQADEEPEVEPSKIQENIVISPLDNDDVENEQDISTLDDALEMAFQEIDNEKPPEKGSIMVRDPIYENIDESDEQQEENDEDEEDEISNKETEPYYQVPKSKEPYYEVPKSRPVPLYENVDIFYSGGSPNKNNSQQESTGSADAFDIEKKAPLQPPKEKPPPPPVENTTDDETEVVIEQTKENFKRINSTKRIKKEIRNKRSSFLGIEGNDDYDAFLELSVAPPPDMTALLQEEKRYEKQLYMKAGFYANSDIGDKDSGVSENHSRQSSEQFTNSCSSEEIEEFTNKKKNGHNHQKETNGLDYQDNSIDEEYRMDCIENQIREQENYHNRQHYPDDSFDEQSEEVLRVERELLQLEQEELKRQRENLLYRENMARSELDHGDKMLMSANRHSLQDINMNVDQYVNYSNIYQNYQVHSDYGQSMPDLQNMQDCVSQKRIPPPVPPAKPLRAAQQLQMTQHSHQDYQNITECTIKATRPTSNNHEMKSTRNSASITHSNGNHDFVNYNNHSQATPTNEDFVQLRNYNQNQQNSYSNMSKHVIHALSAAPKPKLTNDWIQHRRSYDPKEYIQQHSHDVNGNHRNSTNTSEYYRYSKQQQQIKKKNELNNYNRHWLIQEAEQRRIEQKNGWSSSNGTKKSPLPDSIIQTITQRVQSLGIGGDKKRQQLDTANLAVININMTGNTSTTQEAAPTDKVLSVSGKKKCSHCNLELGRGAAMIIESLRLFYHIECFKCSVCHVQLGDGLNGTDVRVRNHKLHCQNCYSSDDGVKFSCV